MAEAHSVEIGGGGYVARRLVLEHDFGQLENLDGQWRRVVLADGLA